MAEGEARPLHVYLDEPLGRMDGVRQYPCAANPAALVVPCHRVVRNDGSIGGFMGGFRDSSKVKVKLLQIDLLIYPMFPES